MRPKIWKASTHSSGLRNIRNGMCVGISCLALNIRNCSSCRLFSASDTTFNEDWREPPGTHGRVDRRELEDTDDVVDDEEDIVLGESGGSAVKLEVNMGVDDGVAGRAVK